VKIGLYDPFLDALGGGEKYFLTIVEEAARIPGAELTIFSPREPDVTSWERLNVHVDANAFTWAAAGADEDVVTEQSRDLDLLVTMRMTSPCSTTLAGLSRWCSSRLVRAMLPSTAPARCWPQHSGERELGRRSTPTTCFCVTRSSRAATSRAAWVSTR
jgi:hypothetical protein